MKFMSSLRILILGLPKGMEGSKKDIDSFFYVPVAGEEDDHRCSADAAVGGTSRHNIWLCGIKSKCLYARWKIPGWCGSDQRDSGWVPSASCVWLRVRECV